MMTRHSTRVVGSILLVLWGMGCDSTPPRARPDPAPAATVDEAPTPSGSSGSAAPAEPPTEKVTASWWHVSKGGIYLGWLVARPGQKPKVDLETDTEDAKALAAVIEQLNEGNASLGLDMHEEAPGGGRGALVTQLLKPSHRDYSFALEEHMRSKRYDLSRVPELTETDAPKTFREIIIHRSGKRVGRIAFDGQGQAVVHPASDSADASSLQNTIDHFRSMPELEAVYHHENKSGVSELVIDKAKPGDPNYPSVVRKRLIVMHDYRARYAYELKVVE